MKSYLEIVNSIKDGVRIRHFLVRQMLAEFLATFTFMSVLCGVNAQYILGRGQYGLYSSTNWGAGMAVASGIWIAGGVTGGLLNPAVTFGFALLGRLKWAQVLPCTLAQFVGAFLASGCLDWVYEDAMDAFDGGMRQTVGVNATAGIFATYPQPWLSTEKAFLDQVFGTTVLLLGILGITDEANFSCPKKMLPICVSMWVAGHGMAFSYNAGGACNPARDLGPRLWTLVGGWGTDPFTAYNYFFWIPIVGPYVGAGLACTLYPLLVGIHCEHGSESDPVIMSLTTEIDSFQTKEEQKSITGVQGGHGTFTNPAFTEKF